ncbi:MAG: hypothetical protein M1476_00915 [Candidatus Thermoplasmatota archaeon]|nr:hypothetical protein [Candidatus Thermoplasmatota archaeon]
MNATEEPLFPMNTAVSVVLEWHESTLAEINTSGTSLAGDQRQLPE